MVTVAAVPGAIDPGCTATVTTLGAFAVSATAFLAAPLSVTLTVNAAVRPATTVAPVAEAVSAKSAPAASAPHWLTSSAPSTEPRPVARLYSARWP